MSNASEFNEQEILTLLKHGDKKAFEVIYSKYAHKIAIKLIQLLKSEELAQDVLQDVFLKLWENRASIDPALSFNAYIYKIAKNISLNKFRSSLMDQRYRSSLVNNEFYNPIEENLFKKDCSNILEKALQFLTDRQRQVFVLHRIEGKSYKEISEELNISYSAINQHLQAANKHLKHVLKPHYLHLVLFYLLY
ncbi:RNA polymerase sigma factor [Sphingobacterium sp. SYP-B4668]|uniref:RNA polymerase sigma factor n=1 Tax=Sphingobacterium sp. SYP-B4668 TaxID=2996035 RepID=UPI0022DDD7D8|nr:RNA polymerase sigma-70 factor [Sphingobacterium sp. SYP-B4668]